MIVHQYSLDNTFTPKNYKNYFFGSTIFLFYFRRKYCSISSSNIIIYFINLIYCKIHYIHTREKEENHMTVPQK